MNKLLKLTLLLILPLLPLKSEELKRGVDTVVEAIDVYAAGDATEFLRSIDKKYLETRKAHGFNWELDKREGLSHLAQSELKSDPYRDELEKLTKKRNYAIGKVIAHNDDPLSKGLRESIGFELTSDEKAALKTMQHLHMKFLKQGESPLENKLIEIDLEYELKRKLLNTRYSLSRDIDMDAYGKEQLYLEIDKMERMLALCKEEPNEALTQEVILALKALPKRLATQFDEGNLRALASKSYEPQNTLEKELQAIAREYEHGKDLLRNNYFKGATS